MPMVEGNNRRAEVAMNRLRIGHVGLKQHMARFNMAEDDQCDTCNVVETVSHFLLDCQKYLQARQQLTTSLGNILGHQQITVKILLGGGKESISEKRIITKCLARYLSATNELHNL